MINHVKVRLVEETNNTIKKMNSGINTHVQSIELYVNEIGSSDRENFAVACLDTKGKVNSFSIVHTGTLNQMMIHPREIFKVAILSNACSIIVGHNHPSGDLTPSDNDIDNTKLLVDSGELLGIPVLDHIIVNQTKGVSLRNINSSIFATERT